MPRLLTFVGGAGPRGGRGGGGQGVCPGGPLLHTPLPYSRELCGKDSSTGDGIPEIPGNSNRLRSLRAGNTETNTANSALSIQGKPDLVPWPPSSSEILMSVEGEDDEDSAKPAKKLRMGG